MPAKKTPSVKIIDISAPDQSSPDPTSRPVVVTNRPVLANDPMMVDGPASSKTVPSTAPVVSRQAKTISPISDTMTIDTGVDAKAPTESAQPTEPNTATLPEENSVPTNTAPTDTVGPSVEAGAAPIVQKATSTAVEEPKPSEPVAPPEESKPQVPAPKPPTDEEIASEKAVADERILGEEEARRQELERLIESGKYAVPINAVRRKRTRTVVLGLSILAFVLAVALFDVALDTHTIVVRAVPHTHFFETP